MFYIDELNLEKYAGTLSHKSLVFGPKNSKINSKCLGSDDMDILDKDSI